MTVSVFVGASVDGFIARSNGDLDWLPAGGGEPHGYDEFIASVDAIVLGRNSFEKVLTLGPWPYGDKRVVVLSSRPVDLAAARGGVVEQMAGPPAEIVSRLAGSGARHLYVDGGITIQGFLRAGLVQRLVITRVPVLIGDGIPLFGSLPRDVRLHHVATRQYPSGLVQSEYRVAAGIPTILVVEDYDAARKALCVIAASFDATAIGAANGEEALVLAAARKPHLVFCDIRMPGMDGFEFLRRLRAIPDLLSVPVIAMSGLGSDVELSQIGSAGFSGHLMKPVVSEVIGAHIEAVRRDMAAG